MLNATFEVVPLTLTYCTLCNAPICYDRRVGDRTLTFGSPGMLLSGNKVMFDDETESLWSQHRGTAIAGDHLADGAELDFRPVAQTTWEAWRDSHPDSLALSPEIGYDYDYRHYEDNVGFFRHYWNDPDAVQPGVRTDDGELPEKESVYGVENDGTTVHVYPLDAVPDDGLLTDEVAGRDVVIFNDVAGDIAVYESPPTPVERDGGELVDAAGRRWRIEVDGLCSESGEWERIPGRHGLFFTFRTQYDRVEIRP